MTSSVENKILLNDTYYKYIIERKKIKNIYFRVREDLKIYVSASPQVSSKYIENLLRDNVSGIEKMYNKAAAKSDNKFFYFGDQLEYIYEDVKPYISGNCIYGRSEAECEAYIYSRAYEVFSSRLLRIKGMFDDLPDFTFKARKMTSKWGVCNKGSMSITINSELIKKPVNLIDYVIIHELCHFKYMNHSKEYWAYVSTFSPYYKEARKELNH